MYGLKKEKFSEVTLLILGNISNATKNILTVIRHLILRLFLAFVLGIVQQLSIDNWGLSPPP
jgi:hypothetical protein